MLTTRDLLAAVFGVMRLVRMDPNGLRYFDATLDGFWRSFAAAFLGLPLLLAQLTIDTGTPVEIVVEPVHPLRQLLLHLVTYAIGWVAYPLAMVTISRALDREARYFRYMVAYNWFQLFKEAVFFALVLVVASGLLPAESLTILSLTSFAAMLTYFWFIAKAGLEVDGFTAAGLVLVDLTISLVVSGIALG